MARVAIKKSPAVSASNVTTDPSMSLQAFDLIDLAQYTLEKTYAPTASKAFHLFFVGRDDVHDILKHVLSRARVSLYLNMFGFDDDELNNILMSKATDPNVTMLITLDKSQAGGKHEKMLLDADRQHALAAFNTHFVIGQSATHQISHTKGFVADNKVGGEGSTNWSSGGRRHLRRHRKAGRRGLQGTEQHANDFHRSRLDRPIPVRTDRRAHHRGEAE
jgi:hypothetical protein